MWIQRQIKRTLSEASGVARVQALLDAGEVAHRTALAEALCSEFDFHDARGHPQRAGCLKALREMERAGQIRLPVAQTRSGVCAGRLRPGPVAAPKAVPQELDALVDLDLVLVTDAAQRAIWEGLMAHEHPRGAGPLVGCQVRYLIGSAHGWLGALGFAAAALQLRARDRWIGWTDAQRRAHLHRVVGLNRFLLRPGVHCRNLASHVLGQVLGRLGREFEAAYGYRPWLVETFVDTLAHSGVSLKAANWQYVGATAGRGRQDRDHEAATTPKAIYLYVLERTWRNHLGLPPAPALGPLAPGAGLQGAHWAEQEFAGAPLGDQRLSRRLVMSVQRQGEEPMRAFTGVAKEDWAAVKGYYRLIDQPADSAVTPENILAPHRAQTLRRMQAQRTVLCIQDGSELNFTSRPETTGLGAMVRNQTGAESLGLHVHSTLAISAEGLPLGVLNTRFEAPQPKPTGGGRGAPQARKSRYWIEGLRAGAELAEHLPKTHLISVMDREADFFSLFAEQRRRPAIDVLVRAKNNRLLAGEDPAGAIPAKLFDTLRGAPAQAHRELRVERQSTRLKRSRQPARAGRKARIARVALRYRPVTFASTLAEHQGEAPVTLWAVHVRETDPPEGATRVEWFLLTSIAITRLAQAEQVVEWYTLRWRIEDWHRVLKSGCRIEDLAHHRVERLERAIAIRMVIAWRIMLMTLLGRETTPLPPELLFSDIEVKVLQAYTKSRGRAPIQTLHHAVLWVAILGGYQNRKHDPPPGHQLMWYGYVKLAAMCEGFQLYEAMQ